jgi:hypothetical protein
MIVSMINLMSGVIMNTARISALADPNVTQHFQRRASALLAILSSDFSSKMFIMDILPFDIYYPMVPFAMMFNMESLSTRNIM